MGSRSPAARVPIERSIGQNDRRAARACQAAGQPQDRSLALLLLIFDHPASRRPNCTRSRRPASLPATRGSALASRMREPSFEHGSRQGGMADAAHSCKRTEGLQVLFIETYRNLFCARRPNRDIEVFELPCELLHAVTRPEVTLFSVTAKPWNLAPSHSYRTH